MSFVRFQKLLTAEEEKVVKYNSGEI